MPLKKRIMPRLKFTPKQKIQLDVFRTEKKRLMKESRKARKELKELREKKKKPGRKKKGRSK